MHRKCNSQDKRVLLICEELRLTITLIPNQTEATRSVKVLLKKIIFGRLMFLNHMIKLHLPLELGYDQNQVSIKKL